MKTKTEFILPLENQVIEILKEVQQFMGTGKYVFPSFTKKDKPMNDNTPIGALRKMSCLKKIQITSFKLSLQDMKEVQQY